MACLLARRLDALLPAFFVRSLRLQSAQYLPGSAIASMTDFEHFARSALFEAFVGLGGDPDHPDGFDWEGYHEQLMVSALHDLGRELKGKGTAVYDSRKRNAYRRRQHAGEQDLWLTGESNKLQSRTRGSSFATAALVPYNHAPQEQEFAQLQYDAMITDGLRIVARMVRTTKEQHMVQGLLNGESLTDQAAGDETDAAKRRQKSAALRKCMSRFGQRCRQAAPEMVEAFAEVES